MNTQNIHPLVSIGIPTYNRSAGMIRAIESVLGQDYPCLDIVISDNASTDHTPDACRRLAESDKRIRYFRQPKNIGPFPNFAFVLEKSRGAFFMWVADDDTVEPNILRRYVRFLNENPDYVLVAGTVRHWDQGSIFMEETGFTLQEELPAERIAGFYRKVTAGGVFHGLMRRDIAARVGLTNLIGADWHFISAMLMSGKLKQFDFPAYNKSLIGLSLNFEQYAAIVGASHFGRCNPRLAIVWHASAQLLTDRKAYRALSPFCRVKLALIIWLCLLWRLYFQMLFEEPRRFLWLSTRSAVKTVLPEKTIRFLRGRPKGIILPARETGTEIDGKPPSETV